MTFARVCRPLLSNRRYISLARVRSTSLNLSFTTLNEDHIAEPAVPAGHFAQKNLDKRAILQGILVVE